MLDARAAGLAAAGGVLAWRQNAMLAAVAVAALAAALVRAARHRPFRPSPLGSALRRSVPRLTGTLATRPAAMVRGFRYGRRSVSSTLVHSGATRPIPAEATAPEPGAAIAPGTPDVRLSGISKRYGDVVAIDHVDLEIAAGEFFTMLGPSGSGKTTTLRMIAGFDVPDTGRVEIARPGRDRPARPTTARSTPSSRTTRCSRT